MAENSPTDSAAQKKPPFDPKALADVANRVELDGVRLSELEAKTPARPMLSEAALFLGFSYNSALRRCDDRPGFDVIFTFQCGLDEKTEKEGAKGTRLLDLRAVFTLEYRLPEVPPSDWTERLETFARVNGVVNAWPYVRSELQNVCTKMGLPPIALPVYRPGRPTSATIEFRADAPK